MQVVFVFFLLLVPATVVQQNVSGENNAGQNISFAALVAHAADPVPTGPADDTIWNKIGVTILEVGSYVAWLGGKLLNWTFNELVLQMGGRVNTSEIGGNINILWKVIRDICNLAFIFGFIYVGFSAIISSLNHGTKTMLAQIIIGAILINFSLYITKVVIDFSNFTAVQIYNNITIDHVNDDNQLNISDGFAHTIGLQTAYGKVDPNTLGKVAGDGGFWFYFIATIFFLVLGFVLAAGGILIAIRFIALLMIMIFSPILFAATVFPKTAEHASDLWHKLFSYAFFAPVYLILLLISLMILTGFTKAIVGANKDLATGFTTSSDAGSFGIVGVFVIAILFLIFALHAAQSMGVMGGKLAVKIGGDIKNRGQKILTNSALGTARATGNLALWGPRVAVRKTVGESSKAALKAFDKWQAHEPENRGRFGKTMDKALRLTDFDKDIRGALESGKKVKVGLSDSYQEVQDYQDERNRRVNQNRAANERTTQFKNAIATSNNSAADAAQFTDAINDLRTAIRNMSDKERSDIDIKNLTNSRVAVHLTDKNIEALEKSDHFSPQQISDIRTARTLGQNNIATHGDAGGADPRIDPIHMQTQRQNLMSGNMDAIGNLPHAVFANPDMAQYITPAMIEARMKNGGTNANFDNMRRALQLYVTDPSTPPNIRDSWEKWTQENAFGIRFGLTFA